MEVNHLAVVKVDDARECVEEGLEVVGVPPSGVRMVERDAEGHGASERLLAPRDPCLFRHRLFVFPCLSGEDAAALIKAACRGWEGVEGHAATKSGTSSMMC